MASLKRMTLAYVEAHPADAASVLEHLPPEDTASLLSSLPKRLAAPLLQHMLPVNAARCIEVLEEDIAASLIHGLGAEAGTAVLRDLPEERRAALMEQLPTHTTIIFRLLLGYPDETVGAWMDPSVAALRPEVSARDALDHLRRLRNDPGCYVFVVGHDQRLDGVVRIQDILRAGSKVALSRLLDRSARSLPARARITSVSTDPTWTHFHSLPVVEREDRFVGALHYPSVAKALSRKPGLAEAKVAGDASSTLASAYGAGVLGLLNTATEIFLPSIGAQDGQSER